MPIRFVFCVLALVTTLGTAVPAGTWFDTGSSQAVATKESLATAKDQTFTRGDMIINYRELGKGDAIILIHGYSANLLTSVPLGDQLAVDHRVVAMDVRGFGKSGKSGDPKKFGQEMTDDVIGLLDHLKIQRAHLIGHSMGALIAANVASRYAPRVSSVSLIAGPFYADSATFAKETAPWIKDLEAGEGLVNFMKWLFPKMDPKMAAGFNKQVLTINDLPSLIATMRAMNTLAVTRDRAPRVPAFVVVGTEDPLLPQSLALSKWWPGAQFVEVKGADHITVAASPETMAGIREIIKGGSTRAKEAA